MYLFEVASRHMSWIAQRQMTTAANIANADTPGYRARDVVPFSDYIGSRTTELAATSPRHLRLPANDVSAFAVEAGGSWASSHSGNNVSLEKELMTASTNNRLMSIDVSLTRSFHRMLLTSVKV